MTAGRSHWQRYFGPVPATPPPRHIPARVLEPACGHARDGAAEAMGWESRSLNENAGDDWASRYFQVTRTGHRLGLPWLDAGLALCIAFNRVPRDDLAIVLGYRGELRAPMVVASDA